MKLQQLLSFTRRGVDDFDMIDEGDVIAIGISGGKDSLTLLYALHGLKRFYPKKFTVLGLTLDMGYKSDYSKIKAYCESFGVEHIVKYTNTKEIIFDDRKETNPCRRNESHRR